MKFGDIVHYTGWDRDDEHDAAIYVAPALRRSMFGGPTGSELILIYTPYWGTDGISEKAETMWASCGRDCPHYGIWHKEGNTVIRITISGDVSEVEHKTYNDKPLVNFKITDSGLTLRASAWGDLAERVPDAGRILLEGSMKGRAYKNNENQDRTSQDITASVIEVLSGDVAADEDLFS